MTRHTSTARSAPAKDNARTAAPASGRAPDDERRARHTHADDATHPDNPKLDPHPPSNAEKDPDDWTTGGEPMTGAQASYLKTLAEEAKDDEAFSADLTKAEASKRIDALKEKVGR